MLLALRDDYEDKLERLEDQLILASPITHTDEENTTLIKKVRVFRKALDDLNARLKEIDE